MSDSAAIRPSWWYASIGVALMLSGCGLFVYFLVNGIFHLTDSLTQVVVPGQTELTLTQPATYTIFLEEQSVVGGRIFSTSQSVNGLKCAVSLLRASAQQIPVRRTASSITYNVNGRSGKSVLEFQTKESGNYQFACDYSGESKGPEVVLAVGSGVGERIGGTVLRSLAAMFGGGASGGTVILVLYLMREKAKKKLAAQMNPQAHPSSIF